MFDSFWLNWCIIYNLWTNVLASVMLGSRIMTNFVFKSFDQKFWIWKSLDLVFDQYLKTVMWSELNNFISSWHIRIYKKIEKKKELETILDHIAKTQYFYVTSITWQQVTVLDHHCTKNEVFRQDFFSKCDQICSFLWIWSHLLKKSLMKNFIFCAVHWSFTDH